MSRQQRAEDAFPIRLRTDDLGPFGRFDNALRRGPDHTDNKYSEEDTQSLDKFLIREAYKKERETNSNIQQLIRRTQKDSIRELGKLHKIPGVGVYSRSSIGGGYVIGDLITTCLNLRNNSRVYVFALSAPHSMRKCLLLDCREVPESDERWHCHITISKDQSGFVHNILSTRIDGRGNLQDHGESYSPLDICDNYQLNLERFQCLQE